MKKSKVFVIRAKKERRGPNNYDKRINESYKREKKKTNGA